MGNLFLKADDLPFRAGLLSFPSLPFVLYRQLKGFEAGDAFDEGIPHEVTEPRPGNLYIGTWRIGSHSVGKGAGETMFFPQVVRASAYPADNS